MLLEMTTNYGVSLHLCYEQPLISSRFVEITAIIVRDAKEESKHKIVIEHRTGARETFESEHKSSKSVIDCKRCVKSATHTRFTDPPSSFLELDKPETKLYFDRKGKARRVEQLPNARVDVQATCNNELKVPFPAGGSGSFFISGRL